MRSFFLLMTLVLMACEHKPLKVSASYAFTGVLGNAACNSKRCILSYRENDFNGVIKANIANLDGELKGSLQTPIDGESGSYFVSGYKDDGFVFVHRALNANGGQEVVIYDNHGVRTSSFLLFGQEIVGVASHKRHAYVVVRSGEGPFILGLSEIGVGGLGDYQSLIEIPLNTSFSVVSFTERDNQSFTLGLEFDDTAYAMTIDDEGSSTLQLLAFGTDVRNVIATNDGVVMQWQTQNSFDTFLTILFDGSNDSFPMSGVDNIAADDEGGFFAVAVSGEEIVLTSMDELLNPTRDEVSVAGTENMLFKPLVKTIPRRGAIVHWLTNAGGVSTTHFTVLR
jgi:hypothetical protein